MDGDGSGEPPNRDEHDPHKPSQDGSANAAQGGGGSAAPTRDSGSGGVAAGGAAGHRPHELFGDTNLALVLMVVMLLQIMQSLMRPSCTC
jgi:hypothetical protein